MVFKNTNNTILMFFNLFPELVFFVFFLFFKIRKITKLGLRIFLVLSYFSKQFFFFKNYNLFLCFSFEGSVVF